jgi:hypothetical protein
MEREARLQGILYISQKSHLSGSPVKDPSFKVPLMESLAKRCPTTRALLQGPLNGIPRREMPHHQSPPSFIYQRPGIGAHHILGSPRQERGPHGERCPYPETFSTYLPGSPVKEIPPPRPPPWSLIRERRFIHRAPFIHLYGAPMKKDARLQIFFYISFRVPSKGAFRPGSLKELP